MAFIYAPKNDASLEVDSTSKAARVTLYDSSGFAVVRPSTGTDPQVYSYTTSVVAAVLTSTLGILFVNRGASRRVRLRSLGIVASQVSGTTSDQASVQIDRVKISDQNFLTGAGAVLPVASDITPTPKTNPAPPSVAAMLVPAGGITTSTRFDTATIAQFALPQRDKSRGELNLDFDGEGADSAFTLDYLEGILFTSSATAITNAYLVTLDWDEETI